MVLLFIALNRNTISILQFAYKDTAFSIALLFLAVFSINIVLSKGEWLGKKRNLIYLSLGIIFVSMLRHNGLLITIPLMVLLLLLYSKKRLRVLIAGAGCIVLIFLIRVPLYGALNVAMPEQTYMESVGLPMTIMGDVKTQNPNALDEETNDFLGEIASDEEWNSIYQLHNYNLIKWAKNANEIVKNTDPGDLVRMTLNTIQNDPRNSFLAFVGLTDMVWRTDTADEEIWVWIADDDIEKEIQEMTAQDDFPPVFTNNIRPAAESVANTINLALEHPAARYLAGCLGLYLLLFLFFGMFSILFRRKMNALILILPIMAYNIITMLLLSGNDFRLFHFNLLLIVPYIFVCFARQEDELPESGFTIRGLLNVFSGAKMAHAQTDESNGFGPKETDYEDTDHQSQVEVQ